MFCVRSALQQSDWRSFVAVKVEDGPVYVPVRPICDYLGIDWPAQFQRIQRDPVLSRLTMSVIVAITDIAEGSRQPLTSETLVLPQCPQVKGLQEFTRAVKQRFHYVVNLWLATRKTVRLQLDVLRISLRISPGVPMFRPDFSLTSGGSMRCLRSKVAS